MGSGDGGSRIAAEPERRGTILKYKADRGPVAYVLAVFALRLGIWGLAAPLICAISVLPLVEGNDANHVHRLREDRDVAWRLEDAMVVAGKRVG